MSVLIETSFGDLTVDLWVDKCPKASLNFLKLCKLKHYNNALFIEVQKNHLGRVLPEKPSTIWKELSLKGYNEFFEDQIDLELKFNQMGYLATANRGSNMNNSEFFITLTKGDLSSLNGKHTVFGKIQEGLDVLRKINDTYVDPQNRPQMNVRILHTYVLDDPLEDVEGMPVQAPQSPELKKNSDRLEALEHLEMLEKYAKEEDMEEAMKKQKAKKQAITLEMLGDLPDANIKPPENILFVCKLNPVTQQRDLEIIFSRFGPIKSVQIVRDWKTGESLQYAFVEFETEAACQEAYLKMNNVLIDDRRIQVDFSQSVSKMMPKHSQQRRQVPQKVAKEKYHEQQQERQKLVRSGRAQKSLGKYDLLTAKPDYQKKRIEHDSGNRGSTYFDDHKQKYRVERKQYSSSPSSSQSSRSRQKKSKKDKKSKKQKHKKKHKSGIENREKKKKHRHRSSSYQQRKRKTYRSNSSSSDERNRSRTRKYERDVRN